MYEINDLTPIGVLTVSQFKDLIRGVLDERVRQSINTVVSPQKEILNIKELSKYIGLSKSHIYKLTSSFKIPHFKKSKMLYFKRSEINEWLTQNRIKTRDEIIEKTLSIRIK